MNKYILTIFYPDSTQETEEEFATLEDARKRVDEISAMPWMVGTPPMSITDAEGNEVFANDPFTSVGVQITSGVVKNES